MADAKEAVMRSYLIACLLFAMGSLPAVAQESARLVPTPYGEQRVVYEFYFDHPQKIGPALYWLRSHMNTLTAAPYDYPPEALDIKVIIHGTEIAALARKNYAQYREAVERMRYYQELGVEFKVCALAAEDFGYATRDFYAFVDIVPSAMTELAHWQLQGYALITPRILEKHLTVEEIR